MYSIRRGTFETNSSSTHSICICTEEDYNKFLNNELLMNIDSFNLVQPPNRPKHSADEIENEAMSRYNDARQSFWKDWNDLSDNDKRSWLQESEYDLDHHEEDYDNLNHEDLMRYHDNLEFYTKRFVSPSGDKMIAFGYYGHD